MSNYAPMKIKKPFHITNYKDSNICKNFLLKFKVVIYFELNNFINYTDIPIYLTF